MGSPADYEYILSGPERRHYQVVSHFPELPCLIPPELERSFQEDE
jgi:hypothetical protein